MAETLEPLHIPAPGPILDALERFAGEIGVPRTEAARMILADALGVAYLTPEARRALGVRLDGAPRRKPGPRPVE